MALDGLVISNIVHELNDKLIHGRIVKIYQPESDEIILNIKSGKESYKLLLSAQASLPLIYLTTENKTNPMVAPNFCMLLRKHINNGKIIGIEQPNFERIINIKIEHLNEMGDLCVKYLIIEIMGKHSNIIFCNEDYTIIDSIKRISLQVSSVREVLPGRDYVLPPSQDKINPLTLTYDQFITRITNNPVPLFKCLYTSLTGISPVVAEELCLRASIDSNRLSNQLNENETLHLYRVIERLSEDINTNNYTPNIVLLDNKPVEFSSTLLTGFVNHDIKKFDSISSVLEEFYSTKNTISRIKQKSIDLRRIVQNALERSYKKYDLQLKQIKDTEKKDIYKVYGELINTYGYNLPEGSKELKAYNYYTNEDIIIPLDNTITPQQNAKKYFDKYNKQKRTFDALSQFIKETEDEITHLESISTSLDIALVEEDLQQLKDELMEYGYIKRKNTGKKQKITSKPFHYISSDGFHMYVGKNNYQNEELTFKLATGNDWWFHAKGVPGSHVIVKSENKELPDKTYEEASRLAAYYSKSRDASKVEVDYTERKNLKKPNGSKPGFVIYHTNYSMIIEPDIDSIKSI